MLVVVGACTSTSPPSPVSGPIARFAVDRITLPASQHDALAFADDLDGRNGADNELGMVIGTLASQNDLSPYSADVIASGVVASSLTLQADSLDEAAAARAYYYGADGDAADAIDGKIIDGTFASARTRSTREPGGAVLRLPVFLDADPTVVSLQAMEIDLAPDGSGGYDAVVRGGVLPQDLLPAVADGLQQMCAADPDAHYFLIEQVDGNRDGRITADELEQSQYIGPLLAPDLVLFDRDVVSFGFSAHVVPCASGQCVTTPPAHSCHDRVRDGDETGVDCGGSCMPCKPAAPSCSDGIRDGFETDVDCGWNCGPCAAGLHCQGDSDCTTGYACAGDTCGP